MTRHCYALLRVAKVNARVRFHAGEPVAWIGLFVQSQGDSTNDCYSHLDDLSFKLCRKQTWLGLRWINSLQVQRLPEAFSSNSGEAQFRRLSEKCKGFDLRKGFGRNSKYALDKANHYTKL